MNIAIFKYSVSILQKNNFKVVSNAMPEFILLENDGANHCLVFTSNLIDDNEANTQVESGKNRIIFITSESFIIDEKTLNSNIATHKSP